VVPGSCVLDCVAVCVACSGGARAVAVRPSVSAVMKVRLSLSFNTDVQAVYGDTYRFSYPDQDLLRAALGRLKGAPFCTLPEEDMSRICQVFVYK
jgi:hypothetical protein